MAQSAGCVTRTGLTTMVDMRILIVEDDSTLAQFLRKGLQEESYSLDLAVDGEEGLCHAREIPYDLIILDVRLPKLDGLSLCRKLRAEGQTTPVLLLTARESVDEKVEGLDTGADDYLTKPFAYPELLARVRALLRRSTPPQPPRLKVGDLELDSVSHKVWRGGKEISLTQKEYALLEYLMRNVNRALTRTAIIDHVWDANYDSTTNIVDVHIHSLRSKIDRDFSPPLLQTVRGVGYMLEAPKAE